MAEQNASKNEKIIRAKVAQAAGQTAINSDIVDTLGFKSVRWLVEMGAITSGAATSMKIQQGAASNLSDAADLLGTSQTIPDDGDNKVYQTEIYKPMERYQRCVVSRATQDAVVDSILCILSDPVDMPITADASVGGTELHTSPIEGTA